MLRRFWVEDEIYRRRLRRGNGTLMSLWRSVFFFLLSVSLKMPRKDGKKIVGASVGVIGWIRFSFFGPWKKQNIANMCVLVH